MPSVSVLIPTYKPRPEHLLEAIESVLQQSFQDWELVIHDDPSGTNVKAMIEPFLADPRIRFVQSPKRLGIGGNWNAALSHSSAHFVQYLFQDDVLGPEHLERAVDILQKDLMLGFVAVNHAYKLEGEAVEQLRPIYDEIDAVKKNHLIDGHHDRTVFLTWWIKQGLRPNVIGEPSFVMMRRDLMQQIGPFNEMMQQGLDTEYWLRLLLRRDWHYIAKPLGFFRVHASAATARNAAAGVGLFDRLAFFDLLLRSLPAGELRNLTKQSLTDQFALMAQKYRKRVKGGGAVGSKGIGEFFGICLRHPILVARGVRKYLRGSRTE